MKRMGYKAGVCLGYELKYTYLAQYCLISFALPWLLLCFCSLSDTGTAAGGAQGPTGLPVAAQFSQRVQAKSQHMRLQMSPP